MNYFDAMCDMTGYEGKTTFWSDFTIAERFGEDAVRDTYKRAFSEWKDNVEYVTELVLVLNWKLWEHYKANNISISKLYDELWRDTASWCVENLRGDKLSYYLRTVD